MTGVSSTLLGRLTIGWPNGLTRAIGHGEAVGGRYGAGDDIPMFPHGLLLVSLTNSAGATRVPVLVAANHLGR